MPRTPLVGRDEDLDDLLELCDGARARLVTILGPGGVGKTRLALEVADRLGADGTRSVWFASLTDLGRDDDVASFLAAQLQVVASAGGDTLDAVRRFLRRPQSVLVLDNVEHVTGAGAVVSSLLDHCPTLTVLTTSRVPLRLRGEHRFDLAPLDESAAVELFRQRSDAARRRRLVAADLQAIGAICELVGRTPLAIELAAARTAVLGPVALLEELRRRRSLDVLTQGPADAGRRHASLRSSLAWSYELLAPPERRVFEVLGAFDGSFTIAAVLAVCDDSAGNAAFDSLSTLVERHVVELVGEVHNETRFTLSPPVRELAHELLGVDTDEVRRRHAIHYAGIARSLARDATREPAALDRLRAERPNVLAALGWLRAAGLPTTALQVAADIAVLSFADGDMVAGRRRIEDLLANDDSCDADPAARAAAQVWAARFALHEQADEPAQRAAVERFREALAQARAAGDDDLVLLALSFVGMSVAVAIDRAWTAAAVDEGYDLAERLGDRWWLAHFTIRKAMLAHQAGDLATADQLGRLALGAARALDDSRLLASVCMLFLGMPDLRGTRPPDLPTLDAVLETFEASGDVVGRIITLARMSAVALATGDVGVGASRCRDALELVKRTGQVQPAGVCVVLALAAARLSGDDPTAARLHGWVRDVLPSTRQFLTPSDLAVYDAIVAAVSRACGSEIFERLTAEGASWTWDEAVSAALATTARLAVARTRPDAPLTDRELEVLVLLAAGDTNKEIARALGVTSKTAMHHCTSIYRKLGVRGRAEAASQAHSRGWLADRR